MLKHKLLFSMLLSFVLVASVPQVGYSRTTKKGKLLYMTLTKGYQRRGKTMPMAMLLGSRMTCGGLSTMWRCPPSMMSMPDTPGMKTRTVPSRKVHRSAGVCAASQSESEGSICVQGFVERCMKVFAFS